MYQGKGFLGSQKMNCQPNGQIPWQRLNLLPIYHFTSTEAVVIPRLELAWLGKQVGSSNVRLDICLAFGLDRFGVSKALYIFDSKWIARNHVLVLGHILLNLFSVRLLPNWPYWPALSLMLPYFYIGLTNDLSPILLYFYTGLTNDLPLMLICFSICLTNNL